MLIRGEKGTAKSTAARGAGGLAAAAAQRGRLSLPLRPGGAWAECPHCSASSDRQRCRARRCRSSICRLGATEDRVLGTLDFERALREGRRAFQPGLLAAAHRGILYIDEVNLLADHLVDVLLDAAAMGVNTVQREGIEPSHPARFILIGTMNPEEGELRPQLLDRFGLMVRSRPAAIQVRAEVVRRRLAVRRLARRLRRPLGDEQAALRQRIVQARLCCQRSSVDDELLDDPHSALLPRSGSTACVPTS